ncbi:Predicted dehydrogenase [Rathayibacter oskolensis]|uniref:Predicted dehydrogenase n=1 Tax=Rathayibacter oskolensis TaxID=1891671 RepID=A0A1X7PEZ8_9MICO|nr:Gfo/Idh/MocA family oxidoreductase [Rathayibacter oskolensis]SMH48990.1 Predicted dehydrogenase [Rathayibacter oskolensis]
MTSARIGTAPTAVAPISTAPITTALIGAGNSGGHYHLPALLRNRGLALRLVATASGRVGPALPDQVDVVRGWEDAVTAAGIELVVVATPHHLHHRIAAAALASGKHVLVDKPFTLTSAEAVDLTRTAEERGLVLAVFQQRRFEADYAVLRGLVRGGAIGEVWRVVAARSHQGRYLTSTPGAPHVGATPLEWAHRRAAGGGVARVIGPHPLDQVLRLIEEPVESVTARARVEPGDEVESWIAVDLGFGSGVTATVEVFRRSWAAPPRFTVFGSAGTAVADDGTRVVVTTRDGRRVVDGLEPPGRLGDEVYVDLVDAIRGGGEPRVGLAEAVEVVEIVQRADDVLVAEGILAPLVSSV